MVLRDAWVVAFRLATRMQGVQLLEHTTLQLFWGSCSFHQHKHGLPKQPKPLLALRSGGILSDQPLISPASTAQASMQRSKMTFGFLQRTADNLGRLENSLLSHRNHLCLAGQEPSSAGTMLLERLSVGLGSSSSPSQASSIHQPIFQLYFTFFKNTEPNCSCYTQAARLSSLNLALS